MKAEWDDTDTPQLFGVAASIKQEASDMLRARLRGDGHKLVDVSHANLPPIHRTNHEWEHGTTLWYGDYNRHV